MPQEETFPIPIKFFDVTRTTHTSLDVLLEKHIDGYWNVDGDRELSDNWTGFTRFTILKEKTSRWIYMVWWETDKKTNDFKTMWKHRSDESKRKEKQKWVIEKPKLDHGRSLRGMYCIDPKDEEFKDIMKNARRKVEIPMPAAMPCKTPMNSSGEFHRGIGTKYGCIVEADESTTIRVEGVPYRYHEDHVAAKGIHSLSHYNLVRKFIPMPQA